MPGTQAAPSIVPTPVETILIELPRFDQLPQSICLPESLCREMNRLMTASITADGRSVEHGGTLVLDMDNRLELCQPVVGRYAVVNPLMSVPPNRRYMGTFHTHPYADDAGPAAGAEASFSMTDFINLDWYDESISIVQSGSSTFILIKTIESPVELSNDEVGDEYIAIDEATQVQWVAAGETHALAPSKASHDTVCYLADKYRYGYYKSSAGNIFERVRYLP